MEALGGNKYFVTFTYDATRKVWVYLLRSTDQVFQVFRLFHAMVEREVENKLKYLKYNNEGEYNSREFVGDYSKYGIRHEKTIPSTP